MLKKSLILATSLFFAVSSLAEAGERQRSRPPVIVSPDLTAPWLLQLGGKVEPVLYRQQQRRSAAQAPAATRKKQYLFQPRVQRSGAALAQPASVTRARKPVQTRLDPQFLPQMVTYESDEKPGTIVIDTNSRFLYLVTGNGQARRYGVGVGKPGFEWAGSHKVTRKAEWPSWTPPSEMIAREAAKGHYLPARMDGGEANPLGARAMYLGSTLYRIHGTNAPWTIGYAVSSGCIRMRNQDVVDLYERVKVGTRVVVI